MAQKADKLISETELGQQLETKTNNPLGYALLEVQKEISHAETDGENKHLGSKYATLKSVIDTVKPVLNKHGIRYRQFSMNVEGGVLISTILEHVPSGHTEPSGDVFVPNIKGDAHGQGSALTYAKRYSLTLACGISADTDDDGNSNSTDLVAYNQCVRDNWPSIEAVKNYQHEPEAAAEAWFELGDETKRTLWLAPTKGGVFTTKERTWIKEDARKIHYGEVN